MNRSIRLQDPASWADAEVRSLRAGAEPGEWGKSNIFPLVNIEQTLKIRVYIYTVVCRTVGTDRSYRWWIFHDHVSLLLEGKQ